MQEVTMHQLGRALIRCPNCADSEVPADLPPLPTPATIAELVPVSTVANAARGRYGEDT